MGLLGRPRGHDKDGALTPQPGAAAAETAWLPGHAEVRVAGESFHRDAIRAAERSASPGRPLVAVLLPEPWNSHDPRAVAVYLQGRHVGFLPSAIAERVQPALLAFAGAHDGRVVSCPARIRESPSGDQVVLLLDPGPLGLAAEVFDTVPELAAVLARLITRLDAAPPVLGGMDRRAREAMAAAEEARIRVDDMLTESRGPDAWPQVEQAFRDAASRLEQAGDPQASAAWLGTARSTRYQRGRRNDVLAAYVEAIYHDRGNAEAWSELTDYASSAPHAPTLVSLFSRAPARVRHELAAQLLALSHGRHRVGRMSPKAGYQLRAALLDLAEAQHDNATAAAVAEDIGMDADKGGDTAAAVTAWRRAVTAGNTSVKVADRLSAELVKRGEYTEAARVLTAAMVTPPTSAAVRARLEKRLARCKRAGQALRRRPRPP